QDRHPSSSRSASPSTGPRPTTRNVTSSAGSATSTRTRCLPPAPLGGSRSCAGATIADRRSGSFYDRLTWSSTRAYIARRQRSREGSERAKELREMIRRVLVLGAVAAALVVPAVAAADDGGGNTPATAGKGGHAAAVLDRISKRVDRRFATFS